MGRCCCWQPSTGRSIAGIPNTGKDLPALKGHIGAAAGVHTTPDGRTILTTGADGLIRRWDSRTGKELAEPVGYVGRIHAANSPDGRFAAVGDELGRLELRNAGEGRLLHTLQRSGPSIEKVTFSPDSKSLAGSRGDNLIQFWDVPSGEEQRKLRYDPGCVGSVMFTPDGLCLLIANCQSPQLYEPSTGKVCWRADYYFGPSAFSPDGKNLFVSSGSEIIFLDAVSGKKRFQVRLKMRR